MGDFIVNDAMLFLDALICGMIIAVAYDCLRLFRVIIPHFMFFINIEDFIFWNIAGIYFFSVMFCTNDGVLRGFFLFGTVLGAYIYKKSFGEFLLKITSGGINYIINNILKKPINKVIINAIKAKELSDGRTKKKKSGEHNSCHKKKEIK